MNSKRICAGVMRARLRGSAKKAKTSSTGRATNWLVLSRCVDMTDLGMRYGALAPCRVLVHCSFRLCARKSALVNRLHSSNIGRTMYTIKQAAQRARVSVPLLRAWERRYHVVQPERTASGYRLYDDRAIARLQAMRALIDQGWSPSNAAARLLREDDASIAQLAGTATARWTPETPKPE